MSPAKRRNRQLVQAAGTVPWRVRQGRLEVLLVHREKYDDWSWPKGKVDDGEDHAAAAVRETREETGLQVRLGIPLPASDYLVSRSAGGKDVAPSADDDEIAKHVSYWAGVVIGGDGHLEHEVDRTAWLPVKEAKSRLSHDTDRRQIGALLRAYQAGRLDTRPLIVVRHAVAKRRKDWKGKDPARPLDARGYRQADMLVELLSPYAPTVIESSPSVRCVETVAPLADELALEMTMRPGLSEECFEKEPERAVVVMEKLVARREASAVCGHRPVLPTMLDVLAPLAERRSDQARLIQRMHKDMRKGEALVCHVSRTGHPRIVAVEQVHPAT